MAKFMLLTNGFEKPTPELMAQWGKWFASMKDRTIEQGHFPEGAEISTNGTTHLPLGAESITGYMLFHADTLQEATALVAGCPFVASNRVYAIQS